MTLSRAFTVANGERKPDEMSKEFTRSGVRTHADIRPLELKSNALTTRPSCWLLNFDNFTLKDYESENQQKEKYISTSGVRTHADIRPLELKSNALTTRPSWCVKRMEFVLAYILGSFSDF